MSDRTRAVLDLKGRWKHLEPDFGHRQARKITTEDIEAYQKKRKMKENAASATVNREVGALKRAYRLGMRRTPPLVAQVPYFPMLRENNVRSGFVEDAAFQRLAEAARGELWLRRFLQLGYSYGWRCGELLGLSVRQVDLLHRTIRLNRGETKNGDGRLVTMTAEVAELLTACVVGKEPEDYVLTRRNGNRIADFRGIWKKIAKEAGTPDLIPHDLRSSAANNLRRRGASESAIMAIGGWRTASMFRRYTVINDADIAQAVGLLAAPAPAAAANGEQPQNSPTESVGSPQQVQPKPHNVQ